MARIYYDQDADLDLLKGKTVAIIGYGNQGRAQALNMMDSGLHDIVIGSRQDASSEQANEDGLPVFSIEEATRRADVIFLLLPDEVAPAIFEGQIRPNLRPGAVLNFASGYNITFKRIEPPAEHDVIMVAPRMIGEAVRELYVSEEGFPAFVAVHQDASGRAQDYALALAKAIGSTKKGAIEVDFDDETMLDLMAEQGTWPLIYQVFMQAFALQVEQGHPEEAVLMELFMSKEPAVMMEKAAELGFFRQLPFHSRTSQYGQLIGFRDVDAAPIREFLQQRYDRIRSGEFAEEWAVEQDEHASCHLEQMQAAALNSEFTQAEDRLKSRLS